MRQIKGNPFRTSERAIPAEIQANLERKYGLDDPWYVQYANYVKGVFTFDLGPSLVLRNRDVNDIVATHFPHSLELGRSRSCFAVVFGIPLGVLVGAYARTRASTTRRCSSRTSASPCPSFLVATLLIYFFALEWGDTSACPTSGWTTWQSKILPVDRARARADGVLRPARARDDARDAAAGLHPHGEGEGPALAARRRPARPAQLADPGRDGGRPAARLPDHRLVRDRADLRHPGHRPLLRHGGDRRATTRS